MNFVIGFLIAVVISVTGVGAGVITAPLLILFLHVPLEIAVSTALAYSALVKLIVVPVQVARRQVNYRVLGWMLMGGLPGVILGSLLFRHVALNGPRTLLMFALGAIILFTSGWHIYRHFRPAGIHRPRRDRSRFLGFIMFPIAAEVGFSSSGAGALGTVALLSMTNLTAAQVVGTDLTFALVITIVGASVHLIGGQYAATILLQMAIGGVAGAITGSAFAPKIPNRVLRMALSICLAVIGVQFCWQAIRAETSSPSPRIQKSIALANVNTAPK